MNEAIIIALALAYAYCKAWADYEVAAPFNCWHTWDTLNHWALAGMAAVCALTMPNWLAVAFAAWLFAQVPFEGLRSLVTFGYWYGQYSRTLPIELFPNSWQAWINNHLWPVEWGQIRFEGAWAPAWDGVRIVLAVEIYWWAIT